MLGVTLSILVSAGSIAIGQSTDGVGGAKDVVLTWNELALQAIRNDRTPPPKAARVLAMTSLAVFEAVNSIERKYDRYLLDAVPESDASVEGAAVGAAHRVLTALFPQQREWLNREYARSLYGIQQTRGLDSGLDVGRFVADRMLEHRSRDESDRTGKYDFRREPGFWVPTAPLYQNPLLPEWGYVAPFAIRKGTQYEPPRPPALFSPTYASAFNEVKRLGSRTSSERTPDQTEIAHFWADNVGTCTPPGHWNQIAQTLGRTRRFSLLENARMFALLNISLADAGILCWVIKFTHEFWRPITGIQQAGEDGNAGTEADVGWTPLLDTPPFPAYTSGHSTFSAAGATVLAHLNGSDRFDFQTTSDSMPGVTRRFSSFWQAAEEAGQSRIYGGIHWQFDNVEGLRTGKTLADYVVRHYMLPAHTAARPSLRVP